MIGLLFCGAAHALAPDEEPDRVKPHQTTSRGEPPLSPDAFDPDPNPLTLELQRPADWLELAAGIGESASQFNPDPGAALRPVPTPSFFDESLGRLPEFGAETVALPRGPVRRVWLAERQSSLSGYGWLEPVPVGMQLPRGDVRANDPLELNFHNPHYPEFVRPAP